MLSVVGFVQELTAGPVDAQTAFKNELVLMNNALEAADAILSLEEDVLGTYKARFQVSAKRTMSSGSNGSGGHSETLRSTPPTGTIQSLISITAVLAMPNRVFEEIEKKSDWTTILTDVKAQVQPMKDVIKELKDRNVAFDKRKTKRDEDQKKSGKKTSAAPTVLDGKLAV